MKEQIRYEIFKDAGIQNFLRVRREMITMVWPYKETRWNNDTAKDIRIQF
jgi:hypothetical protein